MNSETKSTRQTILDTAQLIVSRKGFSAVGLNEILQAADVPKGSFYHYFNSKDAFGVVLLDTYFDHYVQGIEQLFQQPELSGGAKLMRYWQTWVDNQTGCTDAGKCLAVKLGAEVSDLSEPMRLALQRGTARTIALLAEALLQGVEDGSLTVQQPPQRLAQRLYALWLGTSVMSKITRTSAPFDEALLLTRHLLGCPEHTDAYTY
ncbi:MAG: TetR/AcrR family transcriptional regulator [Pseudomonas fluorescens]|jgi:TetR/AcrR family transcriptional repressor of nem operon|uniref:TetR/AcrR family transcriptional regulator n=1 Tax=Pseudomonas TaxID=286 RepID=UPI00084A8F40|nr:MULTISPECIES: TetR/AcrR family transcriptional regulator [Pseudomonas]MEA3170112.1 TetR/AcrR family transcriptional regulator, transcriptional repressor for nem operon [Pseudomonas sp.]MBK5548604.1 TetR/AcrR family transcriptional regulator [Pseudomonas sp. TH04]MDD5444306.1 TetR/AcrR family transcriptional regulator [Pseudomonas fluorescens]OEC64158.1 TetR family transcriptional regulator [Pseudomonas sp. AP19]OPB01189.1 TetR family transcriptional regulator [Pseudomonas fluorescens]